MKKYLSLIILIIFFSFSYSFSQYNLWGCGYNNEGQLGLGNNDNYKIPQRIGKIGEWWQVACGDLYTLALKKDSTLWVWGNNKLGGMGINDDFLYRTNIPVQLMKDTKWKFIFANGSSSFAIKWDGTLWGWGDNGNFQLVTGTKEFKHFPQQITKDTDWVSVNYGRESVFALKKDSTFRGWGPNSYGSLGKGELSEQRTPLKIDSLHKWVKVVNNNITSYGLDNNGHIWLWGGRLISNNKYVTLLNPSLANDEIYSDISSGCWALDNKGWIWGWNGTSASEFKVPYQFAKTDCGPGVKAIFSFGEATNFAIWSDSKLKAWGDNIYGNLGVGNDTIQKFYKDVLLEEPVKYIACNRDFSLFLTEPTLEVFENPNGDFSLYPNPAKEYFTFTFNKDLALNAKIKIINIQGIEVVNLNLSDLNAGGNSYYMGTKDLNSGIYFLIITTTKQTFSQKIEIIK